MLPSVTGFQEPLVLRLRFTCITVLSALWQQRMNLPCSNNMDSLYKETYLIGGFGKTFVILVIVKKNQLFSFGSCYNAKDAYVWVIEIDKKALKAVRFINLKATLAILGKTFLNKMQLQLMYILVP